ncbi:Tn3 family transposase [Streptomyces sp. NBC_01190]|uniref:Tn3 family transposase n=1 Tax=Streptomyces sp. NBC_01190 TaxID=2903767 RepID=UPI00386A664E
MCDRPDPSGHGHTSSYSDLVFGLFAVCGYRFSLRTADISDVRLWRVRPGGRLRAARAGLAPVHPSGPGARAPGGHAAGGRLPVNRHGPRLRPAADDDERRPDDRPGRRLRALRPHLQDAPPGSRGRPKGATGWSWARGVRCAGALSAFHRWSPMKRPTIRRFTCGDHVS